MKKLFHIILAAALVGFSVSACYDDSALTSRLDALDARISALARMGDELATVTRLVRQLEGRVFISKVEEVTEGYRISFTDGTSEIIGNGVKGIPGDKGEKGERGDRGPQGPTGHVPVMSVKQFEGVYYWTADGDWLLDEMGEKVPVSGPAPTLKTENGVLYYSIDDGLTWTASGYISPSTDVSIFSSFKKTDNSVVITLVDGAVIEIPLVGKFTVSMDESPRTVKDGDILDVPYTLTGGSGLKVYCHSSNGYTGKITDATDAGGKIHIEIDNTTSGGTMMLFVTDGDALVTKSFELVQSIILPQFILKRDIVKTYASIGFNYGFAYIPEGKTPSAAGICWGEKENPTTSDNYLPCTNPASEDPLWQVVPAPWLEAEVTYHFRGYVKVDDKTYYSDDFTAALAPQPAPITFNWTEEPNANGFPSSVKVFKTEEPLNGYPFHAWYAIADLSAVECRINLQQGTLKTLETQYSEDPDTGKPLVLVNGGYFDGNNAVGRCYQKGNASTILYDFTGPDKQRYHATRALIGFASDGTPDACWTYGTYSFKSPSPQVTGQKPYTTPNDYSWMKAYTWKPYNGISAGPMLIKDGKILPEFTKMENGYYLNNFEIIASDIFDGTESDADRTAIGYTADGKVILFICDGRINSSNGAGLDQVARIMKGLGCIDAMNLDGGGSTAMLVGGTRVNSLETSYSGGSENRKVATNIGLYLKK
ncbi:MAG: phosphodiester glycosidase family protein [Bacteroidales bacterium]|nr:phosphodiester glycosidase family protein [Bacteroidales bacterium]